MECVKVRKNLFFLLLSVLLSHPQQLCGQEDTELKTLMPLDSLLNVRISTASRHWQKINEAPASISIITSEQIKTYGYETIGEALNSLTGFYLSYDRNYTYLGVRGFSRPTDYNNRIIVLLNGHPMNENVYGSVDFGNELALGIESLNRIEVVRGPGSSLYGTGAMFGVINLITENGQTYSKADVQATYGTQQKRRASIVYGNKFTDGPDVLISAVWGDKKGGDLYYHEYDQAGISNGIAQNLDWEKYHGIYGRMEYHDLILQGMISSRGKGIPTGAYETIFNDPSAQTLDARSSANLEYSKDISGSLNLKLNASYDRTKYEGTYPYDKPLNDGSVGEWYTGEGQIRWDISSNYLFIAGGEIRDNPQSSYYVRYPDTVAFDKNASFTIFSLYVHNEYQILPSLAAIAGLRYDHYSKTTDALTPRLGFIYAPGQSTTIKLLYGEGYRAPNFYETYYSDPTTNFKQSSHLRPEQIKTSEAILEQRLSDDVFCTFSVYRYYMKDLIDQGFDLTDSLLTFQNIQSVKSDGIEVGVQAYFMNNLSGYFNYSYEHSVDEETDSPLTNVPEHLFKCGLAWRSAYGISLGTEIHYETKRLTIHGTWTTPFLIDNIFMSYRFCHETCQTTLKITNVFNTSYSYPGGYEHLQNSIQQDGRMMEIQVQYSF
jgi:outer membrane receptor for ferrienterochelin and colicins